MIPVRLELKNFMSYGSQVMPLDFRGMHLACLSGDNGNGKSAILDAITWALWGEARASADELIRLGTDEMRVTFDFELSGDIYRVIRGRSKKASGNVWEIAVAEKPDGANLPEEVSPSPCPPVSPSPNWRPLTGQGIRDTGKVIQRILRMDYKTFINSAYIQQGHADEFTKQTVADRKKILADILDLSRYDILEQKAKERRNDAEQRQMELDREIGQIETELSQEPGFKAQLADAQVHRATLETEIAKFEESFRALQARQAELDATARRVSELEQQTTSTKSEIANLLSQKTDQERRVAGSREIICDKQRITEGQAKLHSTRETITSLNRRLEELRTIEHEKSGLNQQVITEKHRLDLEQQSLEKELAELDSRIQSASSVGKDAAALRERIAELDKLTTRRAELAKIDAEETDRRGVLRTQHDLLRDEKKPDLETKLAQLAEPGAECPLCHTELSHEKHQRLIDDYKREIAEIEARIAQIRKDAMDAKTKRDASRAEMESIDKELNAGMDDRRRLAQADQMLSQAEEYRKQRPGVFERLEKVVAALSAENFAQEARLKLKELDQKMAALEYDPEAHRRVREELTGLEQFESLAVSLKHAQENLPADEAGLKTTCDLIAAREKAVAESEQSIGELREATRELPAVASELAVVNASLQTLRESDRQVTGSIATLEHGLKRIETLRAEVAGRRKDLEKAKKDKAAFAELAAAFGKKGVQALIIENAIPEIQDEANGLLARMTDNAMQVSIETVKEKKTGGAAETLEIRISDEMGTRNYDLYSGGEAFRVNFALRIALSKLLARRAGARLQTLIIDEGFGTQDAKGREKLVEAIDSIKEDFEKILVITHIDELKDAFPTRIEITKDNQGSQIQVN